MDWLLSKINNYDRNIFCVYKDTAFSYAWLLQRVNLFESMINNYDDKSIFSIQSDYTPDSIAMLIALAKKRKVIVPIISDVADEIKEKLSMSQCEMIIKFKNEDPVYELVGMEQSSNILYEQIQAKGHSGLVLFSSGSTGGPKAIVQDLDILTEAFRSRKPRNLKFLIFLLFDHIGGLNTLFNALSMGATVIIPDDREPDYIGSLIEKHEITLLPTSPTFLNLMLISETYKNYDLSSLKLITYGTEPMPESLLRRLRKVFPRVRFLQTYGTTETGIATTSSKSSDSLYMKIEDPHIQWKVVDGELWLKSDAQMLGYINYNDPFVDDGWFPTGDIVEVIEDSYIKIVGRENEIINVGGQKVLPAEVENVILELDVVLDAVVYGEDNPITGQIVTAKIVLMNEVDKDDLVKKIRFHCKDRLEKYKRPIKIKIVDKLYYGTRFKKKRSYGG